MEKCVKVTDRISSMLLNTSSDTLAQVAHTWLIRPRLLTGTQMSHPLWKCWSNEYLYCFIGDEMVNKHYLMFSFWSGKICCFSLCYVKVNWIFWLWKRGIFVSTSWIHKSQQWSPGEEDNDEHSSQPQCSLEKKPRLLALPRGVEEFVMPETEEVDSVVS